MQREEDLGIEGCIAQLARIERRRLQFEACQDLSSAMPSSRSHTIARLWPPRASAPRARREAS